MDRLKIGKMWDAIVGFSEFDREWASTFRSVQQKMTRLRIPAMVPIPESLRRLTGIRFNADRKGSASSQISGRQAQHTPQGTTRGNQSGTHSPDLQMRTT
jgi:hypothetical protein